MAADAEVTVVAQLIADVSEAMRKFQTDVPNAVEAGMRKAEEATNEHMGKVHESMHHAAVEAKEAGEEAGNAFGEALKLGLAAISLQFLDKIKEQIGEAAEFAEKLKNTANETGDSIDNVQKMGYAFTSVGVNAETATRSIIMMQRKLADAAEAKTGNSIFERAGLDVSKMANSSGSANIEVLAEKLRNLRTPAEQSQLAMSALGRAGIMMLPALLKGGEGLKDLENEAVGAGAVLDKLSQQQLEKLREAMNQLSATSKVFYATFIAPFAPAFEAILRVVQNVEAAFEKLSQNDKLAVVFAALSTAVLLAEEGLASLRGVLGGVIGQELFASVLSVASVITAIVPILGTLAVAWSTNFGNIRNAIKPVIDSLMNFRQVGTYIAQLYQSEIAPAVERLSIAFGPLIEQIVAVIQAFYGGQAPIDNVKTAFKALVDIAVILLDALTNVVNFVSNNFNTIFTALQILLAAIAAQTIPALIGELGTLLSGVLTAISEWLLGTLLPLITALPVYIMGVFEAISAGADIAFPPLIVIQAAILLITAAVIALHVKWSDVQAFFMRTIAAIVTALAEWIKQNADLYHSIAHVLEQIPGLNAVGTAIDNAASAADRAATAAERWANSLRHAADELGKSDNKKKRPSDTPDLSKVTFDDWEEKTTGSEDITGKKKKAKTPHAKSQAGDKLDALKDNLEPYQEAIRHTDLTLAQLALAQESLGDIDTPIKLAASQVLYNKQVAETLRLSAEEDALANADLANKAKSAALERATKNPQDRKRYHDAVRQYEKDADAAHQKSAQDYEKAEKIKQDAIKKTVDYYKAIGADQNESFDTRKVALNNELWEVMNRQHGTASAIAAVLKQQIDLTAERVKIERDLTNARDDQRIAQLEAAGAQRDAKVNTLSSSDVRENDEAKANDAVTKATYLQARAVQDATDAQNAYDLALHKHGESQATLNDLELRSITAKTAEITATTQLASAQDALQQQITATSADVTDVRSSLLSMAQTVAGPVVQAFKLIADGVNPLVSIFLALFEKSKAFADIVNFMTRIIQALADVFDALRPVIDLLLGVLTGIVNVFLTLYNVVASILNVFGAHIEKIRLVNATLDQLNKAAAVPLLQITHELPTANEYNAGKWKDLVQKQSQANDLNAQLNANVNTGFSANLSKLGEILGVLIALKALQEVMTVKSALDGNSGIIGSIKGLWNKFTGAKASDTSALPDVSSGGNMTDPGTAQIPDVPPDLSSPVGLPTIDGTPSDMPTPDFAPGIGDTPTFDASGSLQIDTPASGSNLTDSVKSSAGSKLGGTALNAGIGIAANLVGSELVKAMGGNAQDANVGGSILGAVGSMFGPIGSAVGSILGQVIGGMFGPRAPTADRNPDQTNASINGVAYGQAIANLQGESVTANNQSYAAQGPSILKSIAQYIADGGKGLADNLQKEFAGVTGITNGKNGILDLSNGVALQWQQLVNDATTAMNQIGAAGGLMSNALNAANGSFQSFLTSATDVNLAAVFGNGTSILSGGAGTPVAGNSTITQTVNVNISAVHGADPAVIRSTMTPIMNDALAQFNRQQLVSSRVNATSFGRNA